MRDPIPPSKATTTLSKTLVCDSRTSIVLGKDQNGRIALYGSKDTFLCYVDESSAPVLEAIAIKLREVTR